MRLGKDVIMTSEVIFLNSLSSTKYIFVMCGFLLQFGDNQLHFIISCIFSVVAVMKLVELGTVSSRPP